MFRGSTGWAPHETLALLVTCSWAHWRPRRRTQKERIPRRGAERPMSTMWVGEQSGVTQLRSCSGSRRTKGRVGDFTVLC